MGVIEFPDSDKLERDITRIFMFVACCIIAVPVLLCVGIPLAFTLGLYLG